jgi:diketogulonate reductase-like aldo/keto reductase
MESSQNKTLILNNGETMPTFGLGTYKMTDSATIAKSILELDY